MPKTTEAPKPDAGALPGTPVTAKPEPRVTAKRQLGDYMGEPAPEPQPEPPTAPEDKSKAPQPPPAAETAIEDKSKQPEPKPPADAASAIEDALPPVPDAQKTEGKTEGEGVRRLRTAYDKLKAEHAKVTTELKARLEALEKENAALQETLKQVDYTSSPEYKERYLKPIEQKIATLSQIVQKLPVQGGERLGTPQDVNRLYALWRQDPNQAFQLAQELFDEKAPWVMHEITEIGQAYDMSVQAAEDYKKQAIEQRTKRAERLQQIWSQTVEEHAAKRPDLFDFKEDSELAEVAEKFAKVADTAFLNPDGLPEEELVRVQAAVRNMAAAFGPLAYDRVRLQKRVQELEKEIESFKSSSPKVGAGQAATERAQKKKVGLAALEDYLS